MANKRPRDLAVDTVLDGTEATMLDGADGTKQIPLSTLIALCQGAPGTQHRFGETAPNDAVGMNGDFYWRKSGEVYVREAGVYVQKMKVALVSTETDPDPNPTPPPQVSPDGTVVPDDASFIYTEAGDDWRLAATYLPNGVDKQVMLNGTIQPYPIGAVQLLLFTPDGANTGAIYRVTDAGDWSIWTGVGTGVDALGWTDIAGDPRPAAPESRDPTDPVAIMANGQKVYRFDAAHASPESAYVIPSFNNANPYHDQALIGAVLAELGKTASDVAISYPGTPAARLVVTGTDFQIDFTAVSESTGVTRPGVYQTDLMSSTTANVAALSKSVDIAATGANRGAFIRVQIKHTSGPVADISQVKVGASVATRITAANQVTDGGSGNNKIRTAWFYVLNPPTGTQTVEVTFDYTSGKVSGTVSAMMFFCQDVHQSTPVGTNIGTQAVLTQALQTTLTTVGASSLLLMGGMVISPNTNPMTKGPDPVVKVHDNDIGAWDAPQSHAVYSAYKPATAAGMSESITGTLVSGADVVLGSMIEIRGTSSADVFDVGAYAEVNTQYGGPDIVTDIPPAGYPVPDGTGLDSGGDPSPAPSPGNFIAGVLESHGFNSDLGRSWNNAELANFRLKASAMRTFGFPRPAPYSVFADDTQNIDQIERAMARGLRVLYVPFTWTKYDGTNPTASFPAASQTSLITSMGARLAEIAAVRLARNWSEDMFSLGLFNETFSSLGMENSKQVLQAWVNAVRAVDNDLYLWAIGNGREGATWPTMHASWMSTTPLNDPRSGDNRIVHDTHMYDPMSLTHQGSASPRDGNNNPLYPAGSQDYPTANFGIAQIRAQFVAFSNWAKLHGVLIGCTETGVAKFAPSLGARNRYVSDVFQVFRELGIPGFIWTDDKSGSTPLVEDNVNGGWFTIMQGAAGSAEFGPSWQPIIGGPGV